MFVHILNAQPAYFLWVHTSVSAHLFFFGTLGFDVDLFMTWFLKRVSANFLKETKNPNPSPTGKTWFGFYWFGAGSGGRTHTVSLPRDFESRTSANSIIPARFNFDFFRLQKNRNRKHFPFQNRLASPASYLGIIHHFPEKIKPF